ncbi:hypothetical protein HPHPH43_0152 [Helicobacter pylori Hp H-43]|nr:hypothetical protein HPHPH43_0152 [Helicobacter pylori Hp H-43]
MQLEPYLNSKIKTRLLCCYRFKPYNKSHFLGNILHLIPNL